ncbi:MAG: general secretion pathway protein D [Verrucomicrobia bacterium]|nr:MAG: general secretion pathway protein D [Verrucomicrobiota bacterium]
MSCLTSLAIALWLAAVPAAKAADPVALSGSDAVAQLIRQGRSQYLAGDPEVAEQTFREVIARDPASREAKEFLSRIDQDQARERASDREQTRARLMADVARSWQRPVPTSSRANDPARPAVVSPLAGKLNDIVLPEVSFTRVPITQVVVALSAASEEFDRTGLMPRGVNIVLLDPENRAPTVTLTLRHAPLRRVLDFATEAIGYQYEVQADAVVVRPGGETSSLETAFFPVTRATVLRMAGISDHPAGAVGATGKHPVTRAVPAEDESASGPVARSREASAMKSFLQQAGVGFESVPGASLAYDGTAIVVTQTARNLERIRNILTRYNDVRQVEIEAKFMEVQDGALEELGVNWSLTTKASQASAGARAVYASGNRTLAGAFANRASSQPGSIIRPEGIIVAPDGGTTVSPGLNLPLLNNAPQIPGVADLAVSAGPLATLTGVIGEYDVSAVVRALSQKQGTDLLSAPKVTVLSGNPATITVAQEMRYPQSYGQTQSQVGTGSANGGGSAGVAITAGTPQEFTSRNVGVELRVTPTVEEDNYSISLDLNPKVTEFDGFVEFGGPSIAISGGTTVTVPSGFYQPIFSVRDIVTKVTIWDGATLVMGGLTREEVKKVHDKVPILGDLPLLGRLFRSTGQSAQKRNLIIFVTAKLVNPGGAPRQRRELPVLAAP